MIPDLTLAPYSFIMGNDVNYWPLRPQHPHVFWKQLSTEVLRYTETVLGQLDDLRQEPPCHLDSLTLGVLSK